MVDRSLTPAEIYQRITGGQGPESLGETAKSAADLSRDLTRRIDEIAVLAEKVRAGWHGAAAEEAADSAAPLIAASASIGTNLVFAQAAADGQISAFQAVKNTVKPIGDRPEIGAQHVYDLLQGKLAYFAKLNQWQTDAQHNIDAYTGYHSATGANSDRIPARYAELSDTGASVELAKAPGKPVGGGPPDRHHPGAVEPPPGAAGPTGPVPNPRKPVTGSEHPANHPGSRGPDVTGSRSSATSAEPVEQPESTRTSSSSPSPPALPPGYQFGPSGQPVNPLGTSGFDPESGYVPRRPGGSTNGSLGVGNRVGTRAPGGSMPPRSGTSGTPGAQGKPGGVLGGGMPGKSKEKDKERTAPHYLRETDPDVFGGSDGTPTPPVIGDRPAR